MPQTITQTGILYKTLIKWKMSIQPEGVDASIAHSSTRECWLDLASGYNGTESKKNSLNFGEWRLSCCSRSILYKGVDHVVGVQSRGPLVHSQLSCSMCTTIYNIHSKGDLFLLLHREKANRITQQANTREFSLGLNIQKQSNDEAKNPSRPHIKRVIWSPESLVEQNMYYEAPNGRGSTF